VDGRDKSGHDGENASLITLVAVDLGFAAHRAQKALQQKSPAEAGRAE
jgi:hypothetical protein